MLTGRSRGKNNARGTENGELESSRQALEYTSGVEVWVGPSVCGGVRGYTHTYTEVKNKEAEELGPTFLWLSLTRLALPDFTF